MKTLVSGIQPSGNITLGNYLGAIKNFVKLQDMEDIDFFVFIADLHSITVSQDREKLRKNIKSLAAMYLACGIDPTKTHLFIQSEVKEHAELGYIMQCNCYIGELERMTQYKDKKQKQESGIRSSLLTYPALMAGDILLYDADLVPVGYDQTQHLEITRVIANRFNQNYGDTFKVPEPLIKEVGAKIQNLQDPLKKMSKSDDNPKGCIYILDDLNSIKNKIKSAVTDLDTVIRYDLENKPGISNLMTIYSAITNKSFKEIETLYENSNYQTFKTDLAEILVNEIKPIQDKYNELINSSYLDQILDEGRDYATKIAQRKISKVYQKIGLGRKRK